MGSAAFAFFPRLLWQQKALPAGIFPKAFVAAKGFASRHFSQGFCGSKRLLGFRRAQFFLLVQCSIPNL